MALSDLASVAIIVQGFLFIVSIGLIWYQLRENTKLVRAASTQKLLEYFAKRQRLANHWDRLNVYFEASFAEHVTEIIVRQSKEVK